MESSPCATSIDNDSVPSLQGAAEVGCKNEDIREQESKRKQGCKGKPASGFGGILEVGPGEQIGSAARSKVQLGGIHNGNSRIVPLLRGIQPSHERLGIKGRKNEGTHENENENEWKKKNEKGIIIIII